MNPVDLQSPQQKKLLFSLSFTLNLYYIFSVLWENYAGSNPKSINKTIWLTERWTFSSVEGFSQKCGTVFSNSFHLGFGFPLEFCLSRVLIKFQVGQQDDGPGVSGFQLASVPQMGQGCCHNNTVVGPLYFSCVEQETSLIHIDPPDQHMLSLYSYKICRPEHKLPFIFSWHIFSVSICSPVFISLYSYRRPAMLWRYYVTPFFPSLSLSSGSASQTVWDCLQSGRDLLVIIT